MLKKVKIGNNLYTEISPDEIWKLYSHVNGLFSGGGNTSSSKLISPKGPRARDFDIRYDDDEKMEMVYPNTTKGLSFSDSIERLRNIPIKGVVWMLPKDAEIPKGLVINYKNKDTDHPLFNVGEPISVTDLILKLKYIASQMVSTKERIK
ncbi:hypothetical protein MNBD_GAMMA17-2272 [hydrothermal vent metagenome]|uniref:Tse2 ADP-ribosyltransferase toxin domain-containing protein n=1 Tax=hydrothermal vent metagenome TaxID=652676 RepID=A0A3B0ZGH1_9ZZZZ